MSSALTLHDLPRADRPRERLIAHGAQSLSSVEVLAIILGMGVRGEPVIKLAERLIAQFGSLQGIAQASIADLQKLRGVGSAKACQIKACVEIARRIQAPDSHKEPIKITSPQVAHALIKAQITDPYKEHYILISLDARNKLLGIDVVSIGILDAALVHPRETFELAMKRHAAKVVISHNHPSGDVNPSDDDILITKRLVTAGKILGIAVVDHIIISNTKFYSLQEQGRMS